MIQSNMFHFLKQEFKRLRKDVEGAIGKWKGRFRCLDKSGGFMQYDPEDCCKMIQVIYEITSCMQRASLIFHYELAYHRILCRIFVSLPGLHCQIPNNTRIFLFSVLVFSSAAQADQPGQTRIFGGTIPWRHNFYAIRPDRAQ